MEQPLVSVICICYNQAAFVAEMLRSVWQVNYPRVQLIIADDASTDGSQQVIKSWAKDKPVTTLFNKENLGNCVTFNRALQGAKGDFIIDLAADDVLMPESIATAVKTLQHKGTAYGVFFADASLINEKNETIGVHKTPSFFKDGQVPQGNVYTYVLSKYFINPATMVYRKTLLTQLGGYNEALSYEDFDFWVRSARITKYCYAPEVTVSKRIHGGSVSAGQYSRKSKMLESTFIVCQSAFALNKTKLEDWALVKRLMFESKMAFTSLNFKVAFAMLFLGLKVLFKIR